MARILKEDEHNFKRGEILDAALVLIHEIGYEKIAIQDILDRLKISRGAFYHYFETKQSLMDALVERLGRQGLEAMLPIVRDPRLTAIEKLRRYFEASLNAKNANREAIKGLLSAWYREDNAPLRQKMTAGAFQVTVPEIIQPIVAQGIRESAFSVRHPGEAARIALSIALTLGESIADVLLHPGAEAARQLDEMLDACFDAVERVLGAPEGSLHAFDGSAFQSWLPG